MIKLISIDPGITSGYCYGRINENNLTYYPFEMTDDVDDMWRRIKKFQPRFIIMEDFKFRRGKGKIELFPVQLIGVVRLYSVLAPHPCDLYLQQPITGKSYYSNEVLKSHDLYRRGIGHAMDASRHLLQWFTFGPGFRYAGSKRVTECVELLNTWQE
jgi:hypothetical protein